MELRSSEGDAAAKRHAEHIERKRRAADNLQSLLAASQTRQAEQMAALLAKRPIPTKRLGRRRRAGALVSALRDEIQQAIDSRDPGARCRALLEVEDRAGRLDATQLETPQDRMWHADSMRLIEDGFASTARELGDEAPAAIRQIRTALPEIVRLTAAAEEMDHAARQSEPSEQLLAEREETVRALSQRVHLTETAAAAIDGLELAGTPVGLAIGAARAGVLSRVSRDLFAFKCLVMAAKADGVLDDAELGLLDRMGRHLRLLPDEMTALIDETRSIRRSEFDGSQAEAENIVRNMGRCIAVAGEMSSRERSLVEQIGAAIGVAEDRVQAIIAEVAPATPPRPAPPVSPQVEAAKEVSPPPLPRQRSKATLRPRRRE